MFIEFSYLKNMEYVLKDPAATPNKKDKKGKRGKCKENGEEPGSPEPEEGGGDTVDGPQVMKVFNIYRTFI